MQIISISNEILKKNGVFFWLTFVTNSWRSSFAENVFKLFQRRHMNGKIFETEFVKIFLENDFNDFFFKGVNYNPFKNRWSFQTELS